MHRQSLFSGEKNISLLPAEFAKRVVKINNLQMNLWIDCFLISVILILVTRFVKVN